MNSKIILFLIINICFVFIVSSPLNAKRLHKESYYLEKWCLDHAGELKTRLSDGSLCDCESNEYVFEVDYSNNWRRAIGKALYYSLETGKRASIVLAIEREREMFYSRQLTMIIEYFDLPIDVWLVGDGVKKELKIHGSKYTP